MPHAAAATAYVPRLEQMAIRAASDQPDVIIAIARRQAEREKDVSPLSGCGAPHLLPPQQRLRMRAVPALLVGEGLGGAQFVPAIVELEEVVEEMMRASSWKASLQETNVGVSLPFSAGAEGHDRNLGARLAHLGDESWALHPDNTEKTKRARHETCTLCAGEERDGEYAKYMQSPQSTSRSTLAPVHCRSCATTEYRGIEAEDILR